MANQLQLRRDTAATWASVNPVLAQGELGLDLTNKTFKIGDGTTAWNALPYAAIGDMTLAVYDSNSDGVLNTGAIPSGLAATKVADGSVDNTEFQYLNGVTSAIQTQLNGKAASSHTHVIADVTSLQTSLDAKVSSITLNTSSTMHTTPVTFSVSNGAATGTLTLISQNKNKLLAGPVSGADAAPTFRVLDPADMPAIQYNRQTASYTLALSDYNKVVEMNVATANNLTVPLNSSVAFPIGTQILVAQYGAGQTTIVATGGVTLRSDTSKLKISAQYCGAALLKVGTDEWYVFGALTA